MARFNLKIVILTLASTIASCTGFPDAGGDCVIPSDLRSGDLVLRREGGLISYSFASVASAERVFSHIGIVYIQDGDTSVLHCEAIETNEENSLHKVPFCEFISEADTFAIRRLSISDPDAQIVADTAYSMYQRGALFDYSFDTTTDSLLYCTEYVAKAMSQALGSGTVTPTKVIQGRHGYSIDDIVVE